MDCSSHTLKSSEFARLSSFIYDQCGIQIPQAKKIMLEARLRKRLKLLGMDAFSDYCDYLFNNDSDTSEIVHLIDVVSTNKTDFFREPKHFEFLIENVIPELVDYYGAGIKRKFRIWSAGCSSGEEPYTMTMLLNEVAKSICGFSFSVLASDISTKVLDIAAKGIYSMEKAEPIPLHLKKKYLLKSKDKTNPLVKFVPEIQNQISFRRINFMDASFNISEMQDVIFCRNVMIYFDRETQQSLVQKFCKHLHPGGYLFLGHSESLLNPGVPLVQVASSTYRKKT
jgi:chemotaxis protein methyltransferase CheR